MIKLIPIENEDPYYHVIFNYMIGDADGNTTYDFTCDESEIEEVVKYVSILNKLKPLKDHWGICFDNYKRSIPENILDYLRKSTIYLQNFHVMTVMTRLK